MAEGRRHLNKEESGRYLEVLGIDPEYVESAPRDLALLSELIDAHQTHVPFQTVSVSINEEEPSLDPDDLYEKIVLKKWGGYCFELNKMFEMLLESLGFDVRPIYSRSVRGRDGRMPINHRAMLVELHEGDVKGTAYADVGFGGPTPSGALMLEDGLRQSFSTGEFIPVNLKPGAWSIDRITRGSADTFDDQIESRLQTEIELYEYEIEDVDFELLNRALSQPGSLFRDTTIANLRTKDGHVSLRDDVLTIKDGESKTRRTLEEPGEFENALAEHFGIEGILQD